jgi:hypothetical protein
MGLLLRAARLKPPTMPNGGASVTFVFEARSTGGSTAQKTRYSIPPQHPYVFDNATDPLDRRTVLGSRHVVTEDPYDHSQRLVLRKINGPDQLMVFLKAEVFEVDERGNRLVDGSGLPLPPTPLTGIITIE